MREECDTHVKEFSQDKITTLNFFLCCEIILFSKHPANKDEYIDATRKNKLCRNLPECSTVLDNVSIAHRNCCLLSFQIY